ncbi:hydrolase [Vibrio phage 11895-B1]|uniref:hydrolase n=1 Tax=Vibrio phage 11895-B1 TaxID=754075 RepID=UPI0002C04218|nr:hydrolase [Vibrio phage 11895-B1]AGH32211.1 hypothetical protein VPHG_00147 [Vibrio phage 11895-B1]
MENNYRCYHFANMYLPALHAGIQSQHCLAEMFVKYLPEYFIVGKGMILADWAKNHKTTIVVNGGMSGHLQEIKDLFTSQENPYPWASFSETEYALNGALTNVGIILPEKIYGYDKLATSLVDVKHEDDMEELLPELTDFEMKIVEILRNKRLMS